MESYLDEVGSQCHEDIGDSDEEINNLAERRLVSSGKAPHFDESFKRSMQLIIKDRLRELSDRNIVLKFGVHFERIQNHERFQVILIENHLLTLRILRIIFIVHILF